LQQQAASISANLSPSQHNFYLNANIESFDSSQMLFRGENELKKANQFLKYLYNSSQSQTGTLDIFGQLCDLNYLNIVPSRNNDTFELIEDLSFSFTDTFSIMSNVSCDLEAELCERWHLFLQNFSNYLKRFLKSLLVRGTTILFKFHEFCLSKFINFAYDMVIIKL
jgi:hypothetical protein